MGRRALRFIDPGKPTQNAQIESLNGRIRDELLNAHTFATIADARALADGKPSDSRGARIYRRSLRSNPDYARMIVQPFATAETVPRLTPFSRTIAAASKEYRARDLAIDLNAPVLGPHIKS